MSTAIGNVIADSLSLGLAYADRMLTDVQAKQFARLACPGDSPVTSNHGAFIYGHLRLYAPRIIQELGQQVNDHAASDRYVELFSKDATCVDDPDSTIYPPMEEITSEFSRCYRAALDTLRNTEDTVFAKMNPAEGRLRELFPTIGSAHAFYAGGHLMLHLGQMSAWRRMMGLSPA